MLVAVAEAAHLAWEHFHGGIVTHNLLARGDLPGFWNGFGMLLLPALAWHAAGRAERRRVPPRGPLPTSVYLGFFGALVWGGALAATFALKQGDITNLLFMGLLGAAVLLPAYRAECLLGFVLGMTFVFGAIIPTLIGSFLVGISALVQLLAWPWLRRLGKRILGPSGGGQEP